MEKVYIDSVVDFDCGSLYHQDLLDEISEYNFIKNPTILIDFIKANLNIDLAEEDFELYCDCFDNIYLAFYNRNQHDDLSIYLVSPFNVYSREVYEEEYIRDENLTKKWQKTMKASFPKSKYAEDLQDKIQKEIASKTTNSI